MDLKSVVRRAASDAKLFLRRILRSDFQTEHATDHERSVLRAAAKPIENPLAQDYAVWRRALLAVAAVVMGLNLVFRSIGYIAAVAASMDAYMEDVARTLLTLLFLPIPAATALTVLAALRWSDVRRSRRLSRFAWYATFLAPLAVSLVPWSSFIEFGAATVPMEIPANATPEAQELLRALQGELSKMAGRLAATVTPLILGFVLFLSVAPSVIALCTGIVRSAMAVKTLLPESPSPGWSTVFFGPLYGLLLLSLLVLLNQAFGSILLMLGIVALVFAPLVYLLHSKQVLRPHTPAEIGAVLRPIRRQAAILNVAGVAFLILWLLFGLPEQMREMMDIGFFAVLQVAVSYVGAVLLLTVVSSDFILAMLSVSHRGAREFLVSPLASDLEMKLEALRGVGLTRLDVGLQTSEMRVVRIDAPPPPPTA